MAQYPLFNWGTATYLSLSDTIGVTIDFSITGAPFASDKTYFWQCPAIPYLSGTILMCRPAGSPAWPGWQEGWYPAGVLPLGHYYFTITLPAGQTTVQHEFGSVKSLFVLPAGFNDAGGAGVRTPLALMSDSTLYTATATVSGVGSATVNGASSVTFAEDNTLEWVATGTGFVKWVIDGVEYTSATVFTLGGTADSNGTAYFDTVVSVTGSYTSLGTNGCALSPYANLGAGNVLIQPRAFIFANGSSISNGETVEVDSGESVMISVNTEAIYTRIVSMLINGTEYAGVGTNYASRDVSLTATSDITVEVQVAADRFCYQPVGGGTGTPQPPIPTGGEPPDPENPEPPPETPRPPDPEDPVPPQPPQPPDPPSPPDPPTPPESPDEDTDYIDFILKDFRTNVELSKVHGVYQAKNTQWIKYVCTNGDEPYEWVFGDRSPNSTETSPVHRYYFKGDNLYEVILYAWAEFTPGVITRGWARKFVHVIEDTSGIDPDPDPDTTDPEPEDRRAKPTKNWPDLVRTGAEVLTLRWQDDRGVWSKERSIPLDRRDPHALLHRLGDYRVRSWELVMAAGVPQVVAYMEEEVEINDA